MQKFYTLLRWISRDAKRTVTVDEFFKTAFRWKYEIIKQPQYDSCMALFVKTNELPIFVKEFIKKRVYKTLIV